MFRYPEIRPEDLGPREVYEVKLLMAYFLNQFGKPCTYSQLLEIFTGEGIVDYFLFVESLKELLEIGTLIKRTDENGREVYDLSDAGRAGAESFKRLVPKSVRDRIIASGLRLFARIKNEQTVSTKIVDIGVGCMVNCKVVDSGITLMNMTLFAPDREQAEHIRKKMLADPSELYGRILDYVVCNSDEPDIEF